MFPDSGNPGSVWTGPQSAYMQEHVWTRGVLSIFLQRVGLGRSHRTRRSLYKTSFLLANDNSNTAFNTVIHQKLEKARSVSFRKCSIFYWPSGDVTQWYVAFSRCLGRLSTLHCAFLPFLDFVRLTELLYFTFLLSSYFLATQVVSTFQLSNCL